jgi:hypothetical protein
MASPDDNDPVRSELEYAPPWVREQAQREQAAREQVAPSGRKQEPREQEAREGARDQTAGEQTPREHITRDQFRAALRQSGAGPLDPLLQNDLHDELNPRNQNFGDDRPWHQRALEPELVPEPPTDASGLGPIMLRMGAVCAIAAMVAGAVVFLFSPKQAVHKIAQANVSAPAIVDVAPGAIEASRGVPALTVEPAASIPLPAPDRVASATPVPLPQPETATAPPQAPAISPPLQPDSPAAPAPQIASLPTASPAELRPSTAPAVNEPAPAEANPAAKPAPPPPSGPAQAVPPSVPKPVVVLDQNEIMTLIRRGKALLNDGDFAAARVLFERAANAGSAEAALALGSTYDPNVIKRLGAMMVKPDIESARKWYQLAAERGSAAASLQLANLPQGR